MRAYTHTIANAQKCVGEPTKPGCALARARCLEAHLLTCLKKRNTHKRTIYAECAQLRARVGGMLTVISHSGMEMRRRVPGVPRAFCHVTLLPAAWTERWSQPGSPVSQIL